MTEVEVYDEARVRWLEFRDSGMDVWSPLAHGGLLVAGMRDIVARVVAEQDAFEAGLEWTSGFGETRIESRIEKRFGVAKSDGDVVDIGRLVDNTRLLGAAGALALGASRAPADPTGGAWERAVEVVRGLGIDVTDGVKASAFGSGALALIEAAAPEASESPEVATVGSWAAWLVEKGRKGEELRVPVISVGGATPVKFMVLRRREAGGLLEHPRSALLPLGSKYVGAIRDAWESAGKPAVTWQLDGFKAGSGNQLGASHGGQVAVGMRLVKRGAEVYDSSHVVMAKVEKTAEGGWILKPLDGLVEVAKVGALLGERPAGSISVLAKRECHAAIEKSARERGGAGEVRTHWTSDLDEAAKWAVGDLEELLDYLEEQIRMATQLPKYYPAGVSFEGIRQRVRVSTKRLRWNEVEARELEARRRTGDFQKEEGEGRRAYLRRGAEQYELQCDELERTEVLEWTEAWKKEQRVVVLGDPGFGKTWLLKAECCRLARKAIEELTIGGKGSEEVVVPIHARLSNVNRTDGRFEDELAEYARGRRPASFGGWVKERIGSGNCVVLLDAWDEVPVERVKRGELPRFVAGFRERLGQRLESFAQDCPKVHIVMTSRIVGFGTSPIPEAKEMELVAFDQKEVEAFTTGWFGEGSGEGAELARMLQTNHQVGQLGRIPLMLSMLCRVYGEKRNGTAKYGRKEFPVRRVELYERCLKGLLRDWKEDDKKASVNDATLEAMLEMLETVALDLLEEGHEQFAAATLREAIQTCQDGAECPRELRNTKPGKLKDQLESDGILVRAGEQREAPLLFLHRTFQEYLAAGALARRARERGWGALEDYIDKKTLEAEWDEVVVLLAGRLDTPELLIERLADVRRDNVLRHRLGLAARCLGEVEDVDRIGALVERIAGVVITTLMTHMDEGTKHAVWHLWTAVKHVSVGRGVKVVEQSLVRRINELTRVDKSALHQPLPISHDLRFWNLMTMLRVSVDAVITQNVVDAALELLQDTDPEVRRQATRVIGRMGSAAATTGAIGAMVGLMRDDDECLHALAADALAAFGSSAATSDVLHCLRTLLRDKDADTRLAAAHALWKLGGESDIPHAIETLLGLLLVTDTGTVSQVGKTFRMMGGDASTQLVLSALTRILRDEVGEMRAKVASTLGSMRAHAATAEVIAALVESLRDEDEVARHAAALALRELGAKAATRDVIRALFELMRMSVSLGDLNCSVMALGSLVGFNPEAARESSDVLLTLLRDADPGVREGAADVIVRSQGSMCNPEIIEVLLEQLQDDTPVVRCTAAKALMVIGHDAVPPAATSTVVGLINNESRDVRYYAAVALSKCRDGATVPGVVEGLLHLLLEDSPVMRHVSCDALCHVGRDANLPIVRETLLEMLRSDHYPVVQIAAQALSGLGRSVFTPDILDALRLLMRDTNANVRSSAAEALGGAASSAAEPAVLDALLSALKDVDARVRGSAASTLRQMGNAARRLGPSPDYS